MVLGFKDKHGKFRPTGKALGVSEKEIEHSGDKIIVKPAQILVGETKELYEKLNKVEKHVADDFIDKKIKGDEKGCEKIKEDLGIK